MSQPKKQIVNKLSSSRRAAAKSGLRGEKLVKSFHLAAGISRVAILHHVAVPTIRTPAGIRYCGASTVDSVGFILDGSGRIVAEEIKTISSKKSFAMKEVEPHQRAYLDAVDDAGGVAVLTLVYGKEEPAVCVIPWSHVRARYDSLKEPEILKYKTEKTNYLVRFFQSSMANTLVVCGSGYEYEM